MSKNSAAAKRAREGAQIVHILPLDEKGGHPPHTWGMVEDGALTKNAKLAIQQDSWDAYRKEQTTKARAAKMKSPNK